MGWLRAWAILAKAKITSIIQDASGWHKRDLMLGTKWCTLSFSLSSQTEIQNPPWMTNSCLDSQDETWGVLCISSNSRGRSLQLHSALCVRHETSRTKIQQPRAPKQHVTRWPESFTSQHVKQHRLTHPGLPHGTAGMQVVETVVLVIRIPMCNLYLNRITRSGGKCYWLPNMCCICI